MIKLNSFYISQKNYIRQKCGTKFNRNFVTQHNLGAVCFKGRFINSLPK